MKPPALALVSLAIAACVEAPPVDDVFFVRSAGAKMPVWVRGDLGANTVVVYLTGGPGNSAMYDEETPAFRELQKTYAIAFWEQRASGGTSGGASPDSLTLEQYTADLDALVRVIDERYDHPRIVLLGYSWGGFIGNAYLRDPARQARIAGWVDTDGGHNIPKSLSLTRAWAIDKATQKLEQGDRPDHWRSVLEWYSAHPVIRCSDALEHASNVAELEGPRHPERLPGLGSLWLNLVSPADGMASLANQSYSASEISKDGSALCQAAMTDLTEALPRITIPSLVIWGRHDRTLPIEMGEEAFALLGASRKDMVILEDSDHAVIYDEPMAFVAAIQSFIDGL